jgi:hypothetical protein
MPLPQSPSSASPSKRKTSASASPPPPSVSSEGPESQSHAKVILLVLADLLHNFTDGLALGVSWCATANAFLLCYHIADLLVQAGRPRALYHCRRLHARGEHPPPKTWRMQLFPFPTVCGAADCCQVPHNIADFALLVGQGMRTTNALKLQFITALGATHPLTLSPSSGIESRMQALLRGRGAARWPLCRSDPGWSSLSRGASCECVCTPTVASEWSRGALVARVPVRRWCTIVIRPAGTYLFATFCRR